MTDKPMTAPPKLEPCPRCNGTGNDVGGVVAPCPLCGGKRARLSEPSAPQDGLQQVPIFPTTAMVEAGRAALSQGEKHQQTHARVMWTWEAMLAAAPKLTGGDAAERLLRAPGPAAKVAGQ